jgi:hypothetical protein
MKHLLHTFFLLLVMTASAVSQTADENIATAIHTGNFKDLSRFLDVRVDMAVLSKENNYSKSQAEVIIKNFFEKNKVSGYQVIHRGKSPDGAQYVIGSLMTSTGTYRTYVLTKGEGDKAKIQQLRFEVSE